MEYSEIHMKRIQQLCKKRGITVYRLAKMGDMGHVTLYNIATGLTKNPSVKTLHKIALALGMTLAEFLDFDALNDFEFDEENEKDAGGQV